MHRVVIFIFYIIINNTLSLFGQNIEDQLKSYYNTLLNGKIEFKVNSKILGQTQENEETESLIIKYYLEYPDLLIESELVTKALFDGHEVMIDHIDKMIYVKTSTSETEKDDVLNMISSIMSNNWEQNDCEYTFSNSLHHYHIKNISDNAIKGFDLFFNESNLLQKLVINYDSHYNSMLGTSNELEFHYGNTNSFISVKNRIKKIIWFQNGAWKVNPTFSEYQLTIIN